MANVPAAKNATTAISAENPYYFIPLRKNASRDSQYVVQFNADVVKIVIAI